MNTVIRALKERQQFKVTIEYHTNT